MANLESRKLSLKKNDQVQVIAGKEKGKSGKILKVDGKTGRVTVEKINMVKRHVRPTQTKGGGISEKESPIDYSNILLMCAKCDRGVRHSIKFIEQSAKKGSKGAASASVKKTKIRVCKRCGESLEHA